MWFHINERFLVKQDTFLKNSVLVCGFRDEVNKPKAVCLISTAAKPDTHKVTQSKEKETVKPESF